MVAVGVWLAVGFSLGWYYTFTYYGRTGVPVPMPESCAALILYYFSVLNVDTEWQAVHWMVTFPAAGMLWAFVLQRSARWFGGGPVSFGKAFVCLSWAAVPLALPGPWMAWLAGDAGDGFSVHRMVLVALRRGHVAPGSWLTPLYVTLGIAGLAMQWGRYRGLFALDARQAWKHFPAALVLLVLVAGTVGALAAYPLRLWLE